MWLKARRHVLLVAIFAALIFFQGTASKAATVQINGSGFATGITGLIVGPIT